MNILPKKRWHVRTKDNIARVRRDEAKAAAEEKAIQQRAQLAEQEARTAFLREQAAVSGLIGERSSDHEAPSKVISIYSQDKHINLFNEVEEGQKSWGINKEREAEKKEEQEKYEKSVGYLTYLGQSSLETKDKPWYEKSHAQRINADDKQTQDEVAKKIKNTMDPLKDIQKYLEFTGKKSDDKTTKQPHRKAVVKTDEKVKKSRKKHKSNKKRKYASDTSSSEDEKYEKTMKLELLRAERLRREEEERKRSEKVLSKLRNEDAGALNEPIIPIRDGEQGYNSQFNPHIARKPRVDKFLS